MKFRPASICQTCLSRKHYLCRSAVRFPNISPYVLLYLNLVCVELAYLENSAISKWFSFSILSFPLVSRTSYTSKCFHPWNSKYRGWSVYNQSKVSVLLLTTSSDLFLHILRCLCTTYMQTNYLQSLAENPAICGYEEKVGTLVQSYHHDNVSQSLIQTCNCKKVLNQRLCMQKLVSLAVFISNV